MWKTAIFIIFWRFFLGIFRIFWRAKHFIGNESAIKNRCDLHQKRINFFKNSLRNRKSQRGIQNSMYLDTPLSTLAISQPGKCKFLLTTVSKNGFWVSYTFLQKLSSFKFYNILEEIVLSTSLLKQLNVRLLLTIAAKIVFGWVILSCKSQVFSNNSEFDHHFQEISL